MTKCVSIIIPVYNSEPYITDCIESLINQTYENIEMIFIDDCSPDKSSDIIKKYKKNDNRIKLINNKFNIGAGLSRNKGLEKSTGEFIMFLDPDDLIATDDVISKMVTIYDENEIDAVRGNFKIIKKDYSIKNKINHIEDSWTYNIKNNKIISKDSFKICPSYGYTTYLFKRDIIKKNNIKFPDYTYYEDPYFLAKYISNCNKIYETKTDVYLYRVIDMPNKSWTIEKYVDTCKSIIDILEVYKKNQMSNSYKLQVEEFFNISKEIICSSLINNKNIKKYMGTVFKNIDYKFIGTKYILAKNAFQFILKIKIKKIFKL